MEKILSFLPERYQGIEEIGTGGMSHVYKAYDTHLERYVAIKVIDKNKLSPVVLDEYIKRFKQEARVLAKFSHTNLTSVWDYGEHDGSPYIIMEYLTYGTLAQKIGQVISWQEAIEIMLPILDGISYAHKRNIIHRDIKPSNILLRETGEPVLCDFGVAKSLEPMRSAFTIEGTILGTPEYMAPEQAMGRSVDARADIYAVGIIFYELVTGRLPYMVSAEEPLKVLFDKNTDTIPDPIEYVPDLPERFVSILYKALAKEPRDRYQKMEDLIFALTDFLDSYDKDLNIEEQEKNETVQFGHIIKGRKFRRWVSGIIIISFIALGMYFGFPLVNSWNGMASFVPILVTDADMLSNTVLPSESTMGIISTPNETLPAAISLSEGDVIMRLVPSGEFEMGSYLEDDEELHTVYLDSFYIDEYEVSNAQYKLCVDAGACQHPRESRSISHSVYYGNPEFDDYPVIFVDWEMARTYCEWRGGRLPTEAEWEKAARGTDGRIYPWGDELSCAYANYGKSADVVCVGDTTAVGSYEAGKSVYGLYDMAGNVNEWVSSLYQAYPYDANDGRENLDEPGIRVFRGGSWNYLMGEIRASNRNGFGSTIANDANDSIGFRCAQDP